MNNILNKIIEQGNKDGGYDNADLNVLAEIEKYMDHHIRYDDKLDYNLVCRFILLEYIFHDDEKCMNYLKFLLDKHILDDVKYKAYLVILLAWIEDGVIERSDFTRKFLDDILINSTDLYIKSMLYYLKACDLYHLELFGFEKCPTINSDNIIQLLKLSISSDKYAMSSYMLLSNQYNEIGNIALSKQYFEDGLKSIKKIIPRNELIKYDNTDIQFFFDTDIKGNITDQDSYKEISYENMNL